MPGSLLASNQNPFSVWEAVPIVWCWWSQHYHISNQASSHPAPGLYSWSPASPDLCQKLWRKAHLRCRVALAPSQGKCEKTIRVGLETSCGHPKLTDAWSATILTSPVDPPGAPWSLRCHLSPCHVADFSAASWSWSWWPAHSWPCKSFITLNHFISPLHHARLLDVFILSPFGVSSCPIQFDDL